MTRATDHGVPEDERPVPSDVRAPKVSVVTIAFRDRDGVRTTLDSTREQDWPHLEHIVVDGGSDDGTRELLESRDGVRWVSEKDEGRYDAMNKGASMATGDVLWFMHSADRFARHDTIRSVMERLTPSGRRWGYGLSRLTDGRSSKGIVGTVPFNAARFALGGRVIPHQASFVTKELHDEVGGYDVGFGLTADQLYLLNLATVAEPLVVPDVLCDFDVHGAGSTRGVMAHFRDMSRARRHLGVSVSGSRLVDGVWSSVLAGATTADRLQRRVLAGNDLGRASRVGT